MRIGDRLLRRLGLRRVDDSRSTRPATVVTNRKLAHAGDLYAAYGSADQMRAVQAWYLRGVARRLAVQNPHAKAFVRELQNNVIGGQGIMLQAKITTKGPAAGGAPPLAVATNREIERGWTVWGYPEHASADRRLSWVDIQRLMIATIAVDGEVFLRRLRGFDNPFGYALQFIDADLVDEAYNVAAGPGQNEIRQGVELDAYGAAVAYHVWNRYQTERRGIERKRERIPADEMLHLFVSDRANQTRGVTWFEPVMTSLHHLDQYEDAELRAARLSAEKMGFIINKHPEAASAYEPPKPGEERTFEVDGGAIPELAPFQEFQQFDPTHPNTGYEAFAKPVMRAVARGLGASYFTVTGDTKEANFSSQRMALVPERDWYRGLQLWLAMHAHRRVYADWIGLALLAGQLRVDSRLASNYQDVIWKGRGWKPIDPKAEIDAFLLERSVTLSSNQEWTAERGRDWEDVVDEIAYENEYAESKGVQIGADYAVQEAVNTVNQPDMAGGGGSEDDSETETDDEEESERQDEPEARRVVPIRRARGAR